MIQKSYNNTPTLYLIPTPIGNLEDITIRALNILKDVEVIFSEDTRSTAQLLNYYGIKKKMISNHQYNESKNTNKILSYLEQGYNVGLVTDRGTPIISDPGYEVTKYIIEQGYNVVGLPGATALIPALIISGIEPQPFVFIGFLNSKESRRKREIEKIKNLDMTLIIYESPHRIQKTLTNILEIMGDRHVCISREISKKFEEIYRGKIKEIMSDLINVKGELVIVIEGNKETRTNDLTVIEHINLYIKEGYEKKDAIKQVAKERKVKKSEIYNIYHQKN